MNNFSVISVIDSNNKEVFLNPLKNFNYDSDSVPSKVFIKFDVENSDKTTFENIYVNGCLLDIDEEYSIEGNDIEDYYFLIYVNEIEEDVNLNFKVSLNQSVQKQEALGKEVFGSGKIFIKERYSNLNSDFFNKNGISLTDTISSYQLIRTNPKLSGNIKLVVTENQKLYLDTFKVSETLNKAAYRHKSVSGQSSYSTDVRNIFKSVPSSDLYKVPDEDLKTHTPFTDFEKQYETIYEYGVETNDDEMYSENFKLLAPLWINKTLPDFFVIFRIDGNCNTESYSSIIDDDTLFKKFLRDGEVVKIFDMRKSSPLGMYLQNYYNKIKEYPGSILLQFKEQETDNNYSNGINSWFGLSVDTGLFLKKDETSYFINQIINQNSQDKLNQFLMDGFERNRLLCPNLLNLEFMFNDSDVENLSMNRYFGLYLKENDFITYDYIEQSLNDTKTKYLLKKYNSNHEEIDDSVIYNSNDSILEEREFKDRLFFGIGTKDMRRLKGVADFQNFLNTSIINKPYKNYQICKARQTENNYKNFINFTLKKSIKYGEHFKICFSSMTAEGVENPVVIELIASNDEYVSYNSENRISPYINVTNSRDNLDDYIYYREVYDKSETVTQEDYFRAIQGEEMLDFPVMNPVKFKTKFGLIEKLRGFEYDGETTDKEIKSKINEEIEDVKYPYFLRMTFSSFVDNEFVDSDEESEFVNSIILERIKKCIDVIAEYFELKIHAKVLGNNSLSIFTSYDGTYFQHITNDILDNDYVNIETVKTDYYKNNPNGIKLIDASLHTYFGDLYYDDVIDEDEFTSDKNLIYFGSENLNIKQYALDNKSKNYRENILMFAPINFELLGWRKTTIVKFLNFDNYTYEIESDDISRIIPNTIIREKETNKFYRLDDFEIKSIGFDYYNHISKYDDSSNLIQYYQENEAIIKGLKSIKSNDLTAGIVERINLLNQENIDISSYIDDLYNLSYSSINYFKNFDYFFNSKTINLIKSPYHEDKYFIQSSYEIYVKDGMIDLYSSEPLNISLMGILPIKDFDTTVGNSESIQINSSSTLSFPIQTKVYIDDETKTNFIKSGVYYVLKKGNFENLPIVKNSSFIILDSKLYYYNSGNKSISIYKLNYNYLETINGKNNVILEEISLDNVSDYEIILPQLKEINYYKDSDNSNDLKYSLVSPTICNWSGVGVYYDHSSILKIGDILAPNYKYISKGYFTSYNKNISSLNDNADIFIKNSFDSKIKLQDEETYDYLTFLTTTSLTESINMFLNNGVRPYYSKGFYNKYVNRLEFIFYGIKFNIAFNTNQIIKDIQLQNYNGYDVYLINDYNGNKNEILINTIENVILIVNHNFNFHIFDNNSNLLVSKNGQLNVNSDYKWITTDKYLNINDSYAIDEKLYIPTSKETNFNSNVESEKIVQLNYLNLEESDYERQSDNSLFYLSLKDGFKNDFLVWNETENKTILNNYVGTTPNVLKHTSFDFLQEKNVLKKCWLLNPYFIESEESVNYINNSQLSETEKYNYMINEYKNSFTDEDLKIYIKKQNGEKISTSVYETNVDYTPLNITTTIPVNVKYCIDFYNPNFKDIVNFEINETSGLIKKLSTNFLYSNTRFKSISKIKNYYGYKIFNSINQKLEGETTSLFNLDEKSLLSSNWDSKYYRNYSSPKSFKYVDGYVLGIEDKNFFGSHGLKLRNLEIDVEQWNNSEISIEKSNVERYSTELENKTVGESILLRVNLNQVFYNHFINLENDTFKSNWSAFTDNEIGMNNFIKRSLIKYFKINNKNNIELYSIQKRKDETILLDKPNDFDSFTKVENFSSKYVKENGEIILEIYLNDLTKSYYLKYNFKSNN